ncbi:GATA transcription factor 5-like [Mangifera indica]|uniref:GATA transcription factor 5-like n=1 Tax=Mangifera indica TaxID=29780 RepID=UPI001CFBA01C|nr:GATA transcription factor 5-like [Mangifera indica]
MESMDPVTPYSMPYQTQSPHILPLHVSASIYLPAANTMPLLSSSSSSVEDMECVEAVLKTSLRKKMAPKSNPQPVSARFSAINTQYVEEDFVNGFFDFSNDDGFDEEAESKDINANNSVAPKQDEQMGENELEPIINFEDLGPVPGELVLPAHDVENLEWLSHFVEDSFNENSSTFTAVTSPVKEKGKVAESKPPALNAHFIAPVLAKARRSKRSRAGVRVWSVGSPASSDSFSSSSSGSSTPSSPWLFRSNAGSSNQEPKRQRKKSETGSNGAGSGPGPFFVRRCCHCGVLKTPQWRTGPLGAKSLCNACGVRYKSGRLLPEYRPASSPTFSSDKHSNHHRKVLEMRRKKGLADQLEPGYDSIPVRMY